MGKTILLILTVLVFILIGWFGNTLYHLPKSPTNPISMVKPTPLYKYSIENLSEIYRQEVGPLDGRNIEIGEVIKDNAKFTSYKFTFTFSPDLSNNLKTTSGLINIPKTNGPFPVIVMFRGYVDQKTYTTGQGTQPSATVFANNGFITIAPDFLGYGDSDKEAWDIFETRFQTYVTAATLLKTIESPNGIQLSNQPISHSSISIWGHSNGGQIVLTMLEITGADYPTVLWAPVSKPFPYSILAYTDESDDSGKLIVERLADFFDTYDVGKFSLTNYFDKIKAPIQLNQGTNDTAVPYWWSDTLVKKLEDNKVDITYIKYPGANHNMVPVWSKAVDNTLFFYKSHLIDK